MSQSFLEEVVIGAVPHPCVDLHTTPAPQPSIPPWFAEIVLIADYLRRHGLLDALSAQIRLVRGRFGRYEAPDFLVLLFGYAISGEQTLQAFFDRVHPFAEPFMALFERELCLTTQRSADSWPQSIAPAYKPCGQRLSPPRSCGGGRRRRLVACGIAWPAVSGL